MSYRVVRTIPRAADDASVSEQLARMGVATVAEAQGRLGLMADYMRPIQAGATLAGRAVTVKCHDGDNLMIHAALEVVQRGDVLVVTTLSETSNGLFGELLARACVQRGVAGLIMDAGVRDVAILRQMGFFVWSHHIHAAGSTKNSPGWVNVPMVCAGSEVSAGDFIVADDDGVVVVPGKKAHEVLKGCEARLAKEESTRQRIADGQLSMDFYGLRRTMEQLGIVYVDQDS